MDRRRDLCRFDTPKYVADRLIALVPCAIETVLDLGCGSGVLAAAAASKFPEARIVTVDIDRAAAPQLGRSHVHHTVDLLDCDAVDALGIVGSGTQLVVTNPPFRSLPNSVEVRRTLSSFGIDALKARISRPTADLAFLALALASAREGGWVAAVLPRTLVEGYAARKFREAIAARHRIIAVEPLPERTFATTEARACLVALWVEQGPSPQEGDWLDLFAKPSGSTLLELGAEVKRGRLSSPQARALRTAFHLDGFAKASNGIIHLAKDGPPQDDSGTVARAGDLLVARIGRNLESRVAMVVSGSAVLSDCVFRVRCRHEVRGRVLHGLRSVQGRAQLSLASRGVAAKHLPAGALLATRV